MHKTKKKIILSLIFMMSLCDAIKVTFKSLMLVFKFEYDFFFINKISVNHNFSCHKTYEIKLLF